MRASTSGRSAALLKSLDERPHLPGLIPAREADDHLALAALGKISDIAAAARHPDTVRLLWEVCQIPDFRKVMSDTHARLLAQIYRHLAGPHERLPADWVAAQVTGLDRADGDIDTLMARIAHIRTWTYIAHRPDWLAESATWQERARAIEDRLSDALHARITERFVDRRSALLVKQLASPRALLASVSRDGAVKVEGHDVGRLDGFRFIPDAVADSEAAKTLFAAANRVLRSEIDARARSLAASPDGDFSLAANGALTWRGGAVGRLLGGETPLEPRIEALASDFLDGAQRELVRRRLALFWRTLLHRRLGALTRARRAELAGPARGLVFQLCEALGILPAAQVGSQVAALGGGDRRALARLGVRLGTETIYLDGQMKRDAASLAALLWAVRNGGSLPIVPGGVAAPRDPAIDEAAYLAMGYRVLGPRVLRADKLEKLAAAARALARQGPFGATPELANLAGAPRRDLAAMLTSLGYRAVHDSNGVTFHAKRSAKKRAARLGAPPADSPFAKLAALRLAR